MGEHVAVPLEMAFSQMAPVGPKHIPGYRGKRKDYSMFHRSHHCAPSFVRSTMVLVLAAMALLPAQAVHAAGNTALVPVPQSGAWWAQRHEEKLARVRQGDIDLLFVGDSITHGWEGYGKAVWEEYYGDRKAANIGYSGDLTQHVLWRFDHGELDGIAPKLAVVMIGTNNCMSNTAEEIAEGVDAVVRGLREKLPQTRVLLLAIFPRRDVPKEIQDKLVETNALIAASIDDDAVHYLDIAPWFLETDGAISKSIMPDLLHPNENGYQLWAEAIEPKVAELLGEDAPKGWESMFFGEGLNGWKGLVENPEKRAKMSPEELAAAQVEADKVMREHWKVQDGMFVFDGHGSHLCMARDTEDFDMLVDWKIEAGGDSGIYLRGSPQVQIWDTAQWPQGSGGLYNNKKHPSDPLVRADNPVGEWNHFRIRMIGEEVTVYLNDKLVVDRTPLENYWNRDIPIYPSGQIELQSHGSTLWFKNLYLREIPRGEGWAPLFNGKNLDGWKQIGSESWKAEDGVLYTVGGEGGWLSTEKEYGDVELELEFRVPPGGNSGVFFRAPREGNPAYGGFEVQIIDDYTDAYGELKPWQYTGSVYAVAAPSRRVTLPANTWQKMRVRLQGSRVKVAVNGFPVVDVDLATAKSQHGDHPGMRRERGYIGLQNHGSRLDFRNIRLRELK